MIWPKVTLHCKLHYIQATLHTTLHTSYITYNIAYKLHYILNYIQATLHTTLHRRYIAYYITYKLQYILHYIQATLHTSYITYEPHYTHYLLRTGHWWSNHLAHMDFLAPFWVCWSLCITPHPATMLVLQQFHSLVCEEHPARNSRNRTKTKKKRS